MLFPVGWGGRREDEGRAVATHANAHARRTANGGTGPRGDRFDVALVSMTFLDKRDRIIQINVIVSSMGSV